MSSSGTPEQGRLSILERAQQKGARMLKGLEQLCCEEKQGQLGLLIDGGSHRCL